MIKFLIVPRVAPRNPQLMKIRVFQSVTVLLQSTIIERLIPRESALLALEHVLCRVTMFLQDESNNGHFVEEDWYSKSAGCFKTESCTSLVIQRDYTHLMN